MIFGFGCRPHVLRRIVLRGVGRKPVYGEPAFVLVYPPLHNLGTVCRQTIHEKREMSTALITLQFLEIAKTMPCAHRFLLYREYQSWSCALSHAQNGTDYCSVLPASRRTNVRSFPTLCPRVANYRTIRKSCFVEETKGSLDSTPPFLSVGHTSLCQRCIAEVFLSRARRTGF